MRENIWNLCVNKSYFKFSTWPQVVCSVSTYNISVYIFLCLFLPCLVICPYVHFSLPFHCNKMEQFKATTVYLYATALQLFIFPNLPRVSFFFPFFSLVYRLCNWKLNTFTGMWHVICFCSSVHFFRSCPWWLLRFPASLHIHNVNSSVCAISRDCVPFLFVWHSN